MVYLLLFYEFFKTGLFAIGGGLATLPFLYNIADKYAWFDRGILSDMIAISESTPGPIGVNMATYAGYHVGFGQGGVAGGILGSLIATTALVMPSVIIIIIVYKFLAKFNDSKLVQNAFYGLRPAVTALIAVAGFQVLKESVLTLDIFANTSAILDIIDLKATILFAVLFLLIHKLKGHPVFYIAGSAVVGIALKF